MRQCINPACPAFAEGRVFNADDLICPRCGSNLADVSDDGVVTPVAGRRVSQPMSQGTAFLLALVTFVGVVGVALALAGVLKGFTPPPPGGANATAVVLAPEVATSVAAATRTAVAGTLSNTPIPLINLPTPAGGTGGTGGSTAPGGTGATGPTSTAVTGAGGSTQSGAGPTSAVIPGVSAWRLCRRIATAEACEPVTSFTVRDDINAAIQAGFGPGGARSIRVEWYGPTGTLLQASDPITPGRVGTFWVGFTLKQSQPWAPGVYRAVVYLDNVVQRQIDIPIIP